LPYSGDHKIKIEKEAKDAGKCESKSSDINIKLGHLYTDY
jgi:hypothetical protein